MNKPSEISIYDLEVFIRLGMKSMTHEPWSKNEVTEAFRVVGVVNEMINPESADPIERTKMIDLLRSNYNEYRKNPILLSNVKYEI